MAIYHFSGTVISRSQGRSAIACAAYRSAKQLYDERYDKTHDYRKKQDVAFSEILLPEGAPKWMGDREKLWNAVESAEKRKDAQLAREFNFALPRELTLEQNIELAKEFVLEAFVSQGMVADLCIHNDQTKDGERQPHAHVMLTLREVISEGFGRKVREWNAKENLFAWRELWAETANRHLRLQGHDIQIDHRSFKEQGIDLEPQHKIGAMVAKERLLRLQDHERIARENGKKLFKDPSIALDAVTRQQSTFTHQDLARFVNRHTVDSEQFQAVYEKIKGHSQVVYLGLDEAGRERFTTSEMLSVETRMIEVGEALAKQPGHLARFGVQLNLLSSTRLTDEQREAFRHLVAFGDLKCLVGYAGTGKSCLLGAAREVWEASGYAVVGATLSGIAAQNLSESSGIESRTLASLFSAWDREEALLTKTSVLVLDEVGMIGSRQLFRVLEEAKRCGAKVVLMGDPEQLQAIEAGAAFRGICERVGAVELTGVRRQRHDWQIEATQELATGRTEEALERYRDHDHLHVFEREAQAMEGLLSLWNDARLSQPQETQIILAYTRKAVQELNDLARSLRRSRGELGEEQIVATARGERPFAANERVYFLKNDRNLGVMNGTLGTIESISGKHLRIRLDVDERHLKKEARVVMVDLDQYNHLDHGYAATIHKAQGVTVDRSYLLASPYLDRHATYVAVTRHRASCDIFWSKDSFASERELFQVLSRERAKDISLDYSPTRHESAFALARGFERSVAQKQDLERRQEAFEIHLDESQISRYEELLREGAKAYEELGETFTSRARDGFSEFKREFEREHPKLAQESQERVRSLGRRSSCAPTLDQLLMEYIDMELVQDANLKGRYSLKDEGLKREMGERIERQGEVLKKLARSILKRLDVADELTQAASRIPVRTKHISELGGFEGIKARAKEGVFDSEARAAILSQVRQRGSLYRSLSQDRSRGRSR